MLAKLRGLPRDHPVVMKEAREIIKAVGARHCSPQLLRGCSDVLHASSTTQSMPANRLGEYSSGVLPAMQVSVSIVLHGGRRKVG